MNREEFISYIKDPASLDKSSLSEINELLEEFPYFQSGHLLFLKNLHKLDHIRFGGQLKKSAGFVANREILYRLLFDYNETPIEKSADENIVSEENLPPANTDEEVAKDSESLKEEEKVVSEVANSLNPEKELIADPVVEEKIIIEETQTPADGTRSKEDLAAELKKRLQEIKESGKKELKQELQTKEDNNDDILQLSDESDIEDSGLIDSSDPVITKERTEKTDLLDLEIDHTISSGQGLPPGSLDDNQEKGDNTAEKKNLNSEILIPETHSFSSWLNLLNTSKPDESFALNSKTESSQKRQLEIIDKFIDDNPRITPSQEKSKKSDDIADKSVEENEGLFTETLAQIYIKQGYYSKALFIYKKLSLKFPEKSSYFAGRIKKIEDRINEL